MAEFMATTACNGPKIKDHDAVEQVIAGFYFDPELKIGTAFDPETGEPFLFLYGDVWPEAWEVPIGLTRDEFDPYSDDTYEEGADGFGELLQAIAPYLEEPLTVQAIGHTRCRYPLSACQWQIEADGSEVTVNELDQHLSTLQFETAKNVPAPRSCVLQAS